MDLDHPILITLGCNDKEGRFGQTFVTFPVHKFFSKFPFKFCDKFVRMGCQFSAPLLVNFVDNIKKLDIS